MRDHDSKADLAVATVLRTIANTPGLGIFVGIGTEVFDRLVEAAAARAGVELNSYADYIAFWTEYLNHLQADKKP